MNTKPETTIAIVTFIIVVALAIVRRNTKNTIVTDDRNEAFASIFPAFKKPTLYWFCDSNKRSLSKLPSRGYLEIALDRVYNTQKEFSIVPLIGRDAVYDIMPNTDPSAKHLPAKLWREFVIANILNSKGGLVIDGDSTLCLGPSFYPFVQHVDAATFGINPDEPVASAKTAVAPGPSPYIGWSESPNHPAWSYAANEYNALVQRGPQAWSSALARRMNQAIWEKQSNMGCSVIRSVEGNRLANGKLRQFEDIFGRFATPSDPRTLIAKDTVYISYDGDDLERRFEYNWFMQLSSAQLKESDIVWSQLARN